MASFNASTVSLRAPGDFAVLAGDFEVAYGVHVFFFVCGGEP